LWCIFNRRFAQPAAETLLITNPGNFGRAFLEAKKNMKPTTQVWPVIHYTTIRLALENAAIVARCGCPGVFLISMDGQDDELDQAIIAVKSRFPELKVGGNFLTQGPLAALTRCLDLSIDATWTDRPGVSSFGPNEEALQIAQMLEQHPEHMFFGSVAFKYQAAEPFPAQAGVAAANLGMIATTSGPATGEAVDVTKLEVMKAALGERPLGLASGVSPENARLFTPYVDYFLVSTHVSESPTSPMLSEAKLRALMAVTSGAGAPTT
jgi:hypothetical protein